MRIELPVANWPTALTDAIEKSIDGDVILCHNEHMLRLEIQAKSRMCPDKDIKFEIKVSYEV